MCCKTHAPNDDPITGDLPTRGLSDVIGMMADTVLRNIVRDNRIVTPAVNT